MPRGSVRALVLGLLAVLGCGGTTPRQATTGAAGTRTMLRVGLSPDAPPVAFRRNGRIVGVEPDLAQALADESRRSIALVPMPFDALIPALIDRRIDVIMSGMTVTPARQVRVAFADPYMESGLLPACRRDAASNYPNRDAILRMGGNVGVRAGSTAESWAQENLRYANVATYPSIIDAAREMAQGRLDLIVSDAPQVAWAVSENAGMLQVLRIRLTRENIAWAFRPEDTRLREAANATLATMRRSGRLHTILQRWIPFLDQLERAR
jgi:ABC-type amino acid transport substrate-binding protein